jgi:hypothetical protein
MKKIGIIIVYFGEWPEWFDIFLETCKHNNDLEWIFVTDCSAPSSAPDNTHFEKMTLEEFEKLASKITGVKAEIKRPYKVCDFRPAFGEIFGDKLKKYDFWGWGDIDVLYGNLESIFTKSNLQEYDVISVRRRRTAGALSVFRNEERINEMYKRSPDYKKVLRDNVGYAFDEVGKFKNRNIFSITDVINENMTEMEIKVLFWDYAETDKKIDVGEKEFYWKDGKMYKTKSGQEIKMYHFVDKKNKTGFDISGNVDVSDGFFIGSGGICKVDSEYSLQKRPLSIAAKKVKDSLRWMKDQLGQKLKK